MSKSGRMESYFLIQILTVVYCIAIGYIMALPTTEAKLCSKRVKITHPNVQKIPMTKKIPAKCSKWDRAWTWITKMDCSTKYVIEYVELTTHIKEHYKIEYGCCPGDDGCNKEAHKQGEEDSDDRFLAIAFGSATAALTILIIIIIITVCRKQRHRFGICESRSKYESAEDQEPSEVCHDDSPCKNEYIFDDFKTGESEYEEIRDNTPHSGVNISQKKSQKDGCVETKGGNYFLVSSTYRGSAATGANSPVHGPLEPSAPLLETLSETYVESGMFSNHGNVREHVKEESKNVRSTDDIEYITISKSDATFPQNGSISRDFDIELNDMKMDSKPFNKSTESPFHFPLTETLASVSASTHQKDSDYTNEPFCNMDQSTFAVQGCSYEKLDPNLAQIHAQPYEALKETGCSDTYVPREVDI